jgi:hypothetical protein
MEWELSYQPSAGIIYIKTRGVLEINAATQMRNEGAALIKRHDCRRILLDHTLLDESALTTMETFDLPQIYNSLGISRAVKMALVVTLNMKTNLNFYETVCRNNGYSVMLFLDRERALEWLKK